MRKTALYIVVSAFIASGCHVGPEYTPPCAPIPEQWKSPHQDPSYKTCGANWWDVFADPTLNDLEQLAIYNNHDLRGAIDRVIQARAIAGIAAADFYPQLTLDPAYSNQIELTKLFGATPPLVREHQLMYTLPINLSYEVDFWGKIRDQYRAAFYNEEAQAWDYQTTLLLLTSDLADAYFQLRTADTQIDLFLSTIQNRQKAYDINLSRYEGQLINYSDVSRAAFELSNAQTDYYEAQRRRILLENRIATLIGQPASAFHLPHNPLQSAPPKVPAGVPADILRQRPDIAEAERKLASQNASVGVAVADFYPSLQLTGSLGYLSPDFKHFMEWISRFWAMGANMDQTIFDGGRKSFNLELARARYGEAGEIYQQTVLTALQEVEDALASIEYFEKEQMTSGKSVEAAKTTYQISYDRYQKGVAIYLEVTDSQRDELSSERAYNLILGSRYTATIQLLKALGGNWGS